MALSEADAVARTKELLNARAEEAWRLNILRQYLRDDEYLRRDRAMQPGSTPFLWLPSDAPPEIRRIARISRVNMLKFVVNSRVQSMYVDGFRRPREAENARAWEAWQANRMDARQIGITRGAVSYGASFASVFPGEPVPVIRGASPRAMTTLYAADDDDWPAYGLERRRRDTSGRQLYRLIDDNDVYWMRADETGDDVEYISTENHGAGVTPIVRYLDTSDLDDPVVGIVEPLVPLQDQINITSFGLHVAQHFGAFKQRWIMGWMAETEAKRVKASMSTFLTFEDHPDEIKVGEFQQTDLKGYLDSREATLRHLSTVSQTPAHELLGQLVNLSAEALAAAEASHRRAIGENQTVLGESHEQTLNLAGEMMGVDPEPLAEVVWRDTESRSLAQVADALGKLVQSLGVPPQELWERIPGVTQTEIERWRAAAAKGDSFARLEAELERQAAGVGDPVGADA